MPVEGVDAERVMNPPPGDWDEATAAWSRIVLNESDCFDDSYVELAEQLKSEQ